MEDWQSSKNLKQRINYVFNNDMLSDIHFLVGQGSSRQQIRAHKFLLALGSAVFYKMFYGTFAQNNDKIDSIEIPDIEPTAFLILLKYIYLDEIYGINSETVFAVMYAARKYAVTNLEKECNIFLRKNITNDNVFLILAQARLFHNIELEKICLLEIDRNPIAFQSDNFVDIDLECLCCVIKRDTLEMKEIEIFHAAMKWAEAECTRKNMPVTSDNQRSVLGCALKLIRFPTMALDEFNNHVVESNILTDKEMVLLMRCITTNEQKPCVEFPCIPRKPIHEYEMFANRFSNHIPSSSPLSIDSLQVIRFMVNCPIFILGFSLYCLDNCFERDLIACIDLYDDDELNNIGTMETLFKTADKLTNSTMFEARFPKKILLRENIWYRVCLQLEFAEKVWNWENWGDMDCNMLGGSEGQPSVDVQSPQGRLITFKFESEVPVLDVHRSALYVTSVESGQIPQIIFQLPP